MADFPLSLWYVWQLVECEYTYGATSIWGHGPPHQSIHVALDFFHVQLEVAIQINK